MRTATTITVACLCVAGLAVASDAQAVAQRHELNIPRQSLDLALRDLAQQTGLQIALLSDTIDGNAMVGPVRGNQSAATALKTLLAPNGLSYKVVADGMIAVLDPHATPVVAPVEEKKPPSLWRRLRISQLSPQAAAAASSRDANQIEHSGGSSASASGALAVEEVVVTAQKRTERLDEVPISISVLGGDALDQSSVGSVGEALNRVPGVVTSTAVQGGGTQVAIRGVGASGPVFNGSSPIAYYLDSVPFGLVKTAVAPNSTAFDLERIEVLRGPQGTLYGATAQNGVVRVLTKEADLDRFEFKARAGYSSTSGGGDNQRADAALNVPIIEGKLAVRGVAGGDNFSGWIDSPVDDDVNDAQMRNYRLKINAQPTDNLSVGLSSWLSRNEYGAPASANDRGRIIEQAKQGTRTDYDAHGLKIEYEWAALSLTSATNYLTFEQGGNLGLETMGLGPADWMFTGFESKIFSQEVMLQSSGRAGWIWSLGAFYRDGEDRLRQHATWLAPLNFSDYSESYAVFGQLGRRFGAERFEWTLGLRYFSDDVRNVDNNPRPGEPVHDQKRSFSAVSPRAVLTWFPSQGTTVYASYSEGFRSGFPQNENVRRFAPLEPDELHNYEIGLKSSFLQRRVLLEAAVYYMDWADVQQTISTVDEFDNCCFTALVNGESASGIGVDVGLAVRPVNGLDLHLNVSWNDLTLESDVISGGHRLFRKGDRLNYSSEYTASAGLDYDFALGSSGWTAAFSASANYISRQSARGIFGVDPFVMNGDNLLFGRVGLSVMPPSQWTITLFADNINNEDGAMPAVLPFEEWQVRNRPRTIGLQLDYRL